MKKGNLILLLGLIVGRISQPLARSAGVPKVRLAYIVDTTSAAVACLAFISTWIVYQPPYHPMKASPDTSRKKQIPSSIISIFSKFICNRFSNV